MNSDRIRNQQNRNPKKVILVAYEGNNKTEKNYLNNFKNRNEDYIIKPVPGNETDPINLVEQTINKINELGIDLMEDDKAFCIFDTDANPDKEEQVLKAIELAKDKNIVPIISTPCVELWFLLHYDYSTAIIDNDAVIKKLKKFYPKYEKNCNIFPSIKNKTYTAIDNAKRLEKYHLQNKKRLHSVEANPYTEMYKIVECFMDKNK